jgi:hypothetical protein
VALSLCNRLFQKRRNEKENERKARIGIYEKRGMS